MRWILALMLALAAGLGALYGLTGGFTVLTAEDARRQDVARHPRPIPAAEVLAEDGRVLDLGQDLRRDGRIAIINFFYTRCLSLCLVQGSQTERLQEAIVARGLQDRIRLISVSFDPRDRAPGLARYAVRMNADPAVWQFMSFTRAAQREAALALFGITVVPAPLGEFEHNAAFHIVTPDGSLARVLDLDEPGLALIAAEALADAGHGAGSADRAADGS
ncbi:MAG: SCO family protein [Castellaniella sp.]